MEEERGQLPKQAEQKKQLKKRKAINKLVSDVSVFVLLYVIFHPALVTNLM